MCSWMSDRLCRVKHWSCKTQTPNALTRCSSIRARHSHRHRHCEAYVIHFSLLRRCSGSNSRSIRDGAGVAIAGNCLWRSGSATGHVATCVGTPTVLRLRTSSQVLTILLLLSMLHSHQKAWRHHRGYQAEEGLPAGQCDSAGEEAEDSVED